MKLAIVHDWLKEIGGAERVLIELHQTFPESPIYVLFYDRDFAKKWLPNAKIHTSFLQKIPFITNIYPVFGWLMPMAVESFDLSEFDKVLSSSVTFSKGLVLKPSTKHICYCYSPTRYLWDWHAEYAKNKSWLTRIFQHLLRIWDRSAADRVDQFVAISKTVQDRIKKYYRAESVLIYPGLQNPSLHSPHKNSAEFFALPQLPASGRSLEGLDSFVSRDFYLIVSRLHAHKNIDLAVEVFNKLNLPLVIVGDGPLKERLKRKAGKNIVFVGEVNDEGLGDYYKACKALIMPQEEDFGLTPVEAMSFGKPVVALRSGGAVETVIEGKTGEFFEDPIPESLAHAVQRLNERYKSYDPEFITSHASQFSSEHFRKAVTQLVYGKPETHPSQ